MAQNNDINCNLDNKEEQNWNAPKDFSSLSERMLKVAFGEDFDTMKDENVCDYPSK